MDTAELSKDSFHIDPKTKQKIDLDAIKDEDKNNVEIGPREKYGRLPRLRDDTSEEENKDAGKDEGVDKDDEDEDEDDGITTYCPGCETGADADSAHCSGHEGTGYHPDCYKMSSVYNPLDEHTDFRFHLY